MANNGELAKRLLDALRQKGTDGLTFYPKQAAFVESEAANAAFVAGIGSGKTYAGAARSLKAAYGRIGSREIPVPNLGIVTAPTYPMLRDATVRTLLEIGDEYVQAYNKGDMSILFTNGSEVLLRSTDNPDRLRGPNASWWWGDEAAMYDSSVWRIMVGRLRQYGERGAAWLTTTPRGRDWIYKQFVMDEREGYELHRAASYDNEHLSADILASWSDEYAGDYARQELHGEFVAHQGLVYDEFRHETHITDSYPTQFADVVAGVDWGYANPGVMLVGGLDGDGTIWLIAEAYATQVRIDEWVLIASELRSGYGVKRFVCDPSEPDYIKALEEAGLPALPAHNSVLTGLQAVKRRLSTATLRENQQVPRLMIHRSCTNLIREFEQYEWRDGRDGKLDSVVKARDHAMDAMRYLVMSIDQPHIKKLSAKVIRYA